MNAFHSWDSVKREIFDVEDLDEIELGARRLVAESRAHRLVEMRQEHGPDVRS
ncbi:MULTISPECIES: hypothetical protein [unclassified Streptomyces]|uniref:hypothetical protein n=1 Tax=unclassified Streptomyces TaxID=2593676 RepID=UPI0022561C23|nr:MULTISPECIES: hypothetical protein [unclassified Streptomyces]WSP56366.1 hypothetical protein OG306_19820 [Streptomyces sp. NBC_01241]WSU22917.1 hypothetical protein OG508_19415 [Streptomyces sp. NBC_01108]MCX4788096.1 hypothetical protein [Streptomyces sp. NBC_01221]MCX4796143.1 hypothetical protein [Streptomyces sp. NBC_01242]WSJ37402.1 hypothetical protein OG772_16095 [Streptomyces sp. NBC_01321]